MPPQVLQRFSQASPFDCTPTITQGIQEKSEPKPLTGILSPGMGVEEVDN